MKKEDFYFELPDNLIAQYPLPNRSDSRLLVCEGGTNEYQHRQFKTLIDFLEPGDLLVMNNSRVIPARLYGLKQTGGQVELLIERLLDQQFFWAHIKASKALKPGAQIFFERGWCVEVIGREDDLFQCRTQGKTQEMLHQVGHVPLPLYIERQDEPLDLNRYQTVYAKHDGSVAAPTAGLHFDDRLITALQQKGIRIAYTTLHIGAGTFRPVRSEYLKDHKMHREFFSVDKTVCQAVQTTREAGNRVIAVGTTALRSLESAALGGEIHPCSRETDIFIYPGFEFQICDGLVTNFHLPESTLIMLVAAFIGHTQALDLYQTAVKHEYRFFSYGDACFLLRRP